MNKKEVISNYHWYEVNYKEDEDLEDEELHACFTYKGEDYFLHEFMRFNFMNNDYNGYWSGYLNFTYDSGLVVKMSDHGEAVQVGRYF